MFVQVIRGKVKDKAAIQAATDRWTQELKPGAIGVLGATEGVTDDGTYVNVVRFESEEAARRNSDRPEQGAWWQETSKLFDGDVTFYDCPTVDVFGGGGSDEAGFVQLMVYRPKDVDAVRKMAKEFEKYMSHRPDLIGGTTAYAADGTVIDVNYFTSEAEAREGEKKEMPPDFDQSVMESFMENIGDVDYLDLREPRMISA